MTPQEFKSWFDGFTEAMSGVPTKAQWARVKERVSEIDGKPVTERVFIDRYLPSYPRYPYWYNAYGQALGGSPSMLCSSTGTGNLAQTQNNAAIQAQYSSAAAMQALGRADAESMKQ